MGAGPGGLRQGLYFLGGIREHWARKQLRIPADPRGLGADQSARERQGDLPLPGKNLEGKLHFRFVNPFPFASLRSKIGH